MNVTEGRSKRTEPGGSPRWLLLAYQVPSEPSRLRVKVWRRLQAVGAVLLKNSVYVLPNTPEAREHIEWIRGEIATAGGEAAVLVADAVDDGTADEIVDAFVAARRGDWEELRERASDLLGRIRGGGRDETGGGLGREVRGLRNRAAQIDRIDYLQSPGRREALAAIEAVAGAFGRESPPTEGPAMRPVADYEGRRWLTRPRPGVDRMASAWLIRRFIDPKACFDFGEQPADDESVPFDMFGVEFGHHGERCTFETLLATFDLDEPPLNRIARIVHDLDLNVESVADSETRTVGRLVDGLRLAIDEDGLLLERGMDVFEALYQSFRGEHSGGSSGSPKSA